MATLRLGSREVNNVVISLVTDAFGGRLTNDGQKGDKVIIDVEYYAKSKEVRVVWSGIENTQYKHMMDWKETDEDMQVVITSTDNYLFLFVVAEGKGSVGEEIRINQDQIDFIQVNSV